MGDAIKWVALLFLGYLAISWLRNGVNFSAQASPNIFGGQGMMYAPGASWMNLFPWSQTQKRSIYVNYSPYDNSTTFAAGF